LFAGGRDATLTCGGCERSLSSADDSGELAEPTVTLSGSSEPAVTTPTMALGAESNRQVGADTLLPAGSRVGRYLVVDHIDSGGMGAVYRAFDPDLNRQVAIKILRMRSVPSEEEEANRSRLLREAQALAQVSHPNVIAVHDVGVIDGRVFVAMELVAGASLRTWLAAKQRSPEEVLRAFLQAGDGLAAAHASGLVHRDFKPDNVIVGDDGRVRVIDFGLARTADAGAAGEDADDVDKRPVQIDELSTQSSLSSTSGMLSESMTRTGAVLGTPRYMAPEQFLREGTDAKADQFAFCVAAYEALCKRRPFAGKHFEELRVNVLTGRVRPPGSDAHVAKSHVRALLRGLSSNPADRYPSMEALLDELRRDPWLWWRRAGIAAAAVAIVGVAGVLSFRAGEAPALCQDSAKQMAGVWDAATRSAVERGLEASGHPRAAKTWQRTAPVLDRFASQWQSMHADSCRATLVRGEQSELLFERRARCLRRRLEQVDGFVGLLEADLDGDLVDKAATAARELTSLDECADDERLLANVPLPEDQATRKRVETSFTKLDRAAMLEKAGRYKQSFEILEELDTAAEDIEYPPLQAPLTFKLAMLTERTGDAAAAEALYFKAIDLAARAKNTDIAGQAWNEILWVVGHRLGRYKEALQFAPAVKFAIALADDDDRLLARYESCTGVLMYGVGNYPESLASFERAVALWERLGDAHLHDLANELSNLGVGYSLNERTDDAIRTYERSHALLEKTLGKGHPLTKLPIFNLADARSARGEFEEALALHRQALAMNIETFGKDHPETAHSHHNIGDVHLAMEDYPRAIESLSTSLHGWEAHFGKDHVRTSMTLESLGRAHMGNRDFALAGELLRRSARVIATELGADHPNTVGVNAALGHNEFAQGRFATARPHYEAARRVAAAQYGENHHTVATIDVYLARCDAHLGRARQALERARTARDVLVAHADETLALASTAMAAWADFAVAEAMWEARADRAGALALARSAIAPLDRPGSRRRAATVTAWLQARNAADAPAP